MQATVIQATPATYRERLAKLHPGDVLQLAPGTYERNLPLERLQGTASQPIVIRGAPDLTTVLLAQSCCNTVQLRNTHYVEVRDLTLDGGNLDGPVGVDSREECSHIVLENLRIVHYGANQQDVAISTKGPAWDWVIRGNMIVGAGTGLYLGNSDGTQPFVAGVIESNLILDTRGYNIQIKHQNSRPRGVRLPDGASRTVIRYNVLSKSRNAATGHDARPNLLVGHFPATGAGARDLYEIYGNLLYENPTEALFQGEGNVDLHDNLFVNSRGAAIVIRPQNARPRNVVVAHNTVIAQGAGIRVWGGEPGYRQRIAHNAVFSPRPIDGPNLTDNLTGAYSTAADWLSAPFAPLGMLDLHPKPGLFTTPRPGTRPSPAANASRDITAPAVDFDGCPRVSNAPGAYERAASPGAWFPVLAVRPDPQREVRHVCVLPDAAAATEPH